MMHELLFTFAIEKLGRIGLLGPALSLAMMMLCGQNQQLPLPGTVQSKTHSFPPQEISATRHMAGLPLSMSPPSPTPEHKAGGQFVHSTVFGLHAGDYHL